MGVYNIEVGDDLTGFCKLQSAFVTPLKPAATDAFRARSITMGDVKNRVFPGDRRGTRSRVERIEGRQPVIPWSAQVVFRPSGALGTAPDIGDLLKLALGVETITGSTSVVYTPLKDPTAIYATIYRKGTSMVELVHGAIVQTLRISWSGDDFVTMDFSGIARNFAEAGTTTTSGTNATTASTGVTVADADFLRAYGVVSVGAFNASGAGFQIASVNYTTEGIVLDATVTYNTGQTVAPYLPTATLTGNPLHSAGRATLSLDGGATTIGNLSGFIEIATGLDLWNREAQSSSAVDVFMASQREVSFGFEILNKKAESYLLSLFSRKVSQDLQIILGDTSTEKLKIDMDVCQIDPSPRDLPESGPGTISLTGVALASSAGEDEITLTLI